MGVNWLLNAYFSSSPLALSGPCDRAGFLSHIVIILLPASLNYITNHLKWCRNRKMMAYFYGSITLGELLKVHERFHEYLTIAWTVINNQKPHEEVHQNYSLQFLNLIFHFFRIWLFPWFFIYGDISINSPMIVQRFLQSEWYSLACHQLTNI